MKTYTKNSMALRVSAVGIVALVLGASFGIGGAHAAPACAKPSDLSGVFDMGGKKMAPFKIVATNTYNTVAGNPYREFEIADWSSSKCAWSTRTRLVSEGHMHLEPAKQAEAQTQR